MNSLSSANSVVDPIAHLTAGGVELVGIAIIVLGAAIASIGFIKRLFQQGRFSKNYKSFRADLGRAILLGLEFLVAADIIITVAVDPSLERVGTLGLIVLIRTFLSFALEVEIDGRFPWQRGESSERDRV